jgi:hypothetical protein
MQESTKHVVAMTGVALGVVVICVISIVAVSFVVSMGRKDSKKTSSTPTTTSTSTPSPDRKLVGGAAGVNPDCRKLTHLSYVDKATNCAGGSARIPVIGDISACVRYAPVGLDAIHISKMTDGLGATGVLSTPDGKTVTVLPDCATGDVRAVVPGQRITYVDEDGAVRYAFGTCLARALASSAVGSSGVGSRYTDVRVVSGLSLRGVLPTGASRNDWLAQLDSCRSLGPEYQPVAMVWDSDVRVGVTGGSGVGVRGNAGDAMAAMQKALAKQPELPVAVVCARRAKQACVA